MLILRTGLPGAGKTLNTIKEIDEANAPHPENPLHRLYPDPDDPDLPPRIVYYNGIPELDIPRLKSNWVEFNTPEEWFNLPDGSIIVIDEAQRIFGSTERGRPDKVARFETHRHQGLDIHLITQDPSLLTKHVRVLVGKHIHVWRPYGREKGVIRHEYEMCIDSPNKRSNFSLAQEEKIDLDPNYFGTYKSSTVHTHKKTKPGYLKKLPAIFAVIILAFGLLGFLLWSIIHSANGEREELQSKQSHKESGQPVNKPSQAEPGQTQPESGQSPIQSASKDMDAFVYRNTPRIPGLPQTAPKYDDLTKPKDFPRPHCMASYDPKVVQSGRMPTATIDGTRVACKCYSQQATSMDVPVDQCLNIVNNGLFDDTKMMANYASGDTRGVSRTGGPQHQTTLNGAQAERAPAATAARRIPPASEAPQAEYVNMRYQGVPAGAW